MKESAVPCYRNNTFFFEFFNSNFNWFFYLRIEHAILTRLKRQPVDFLVKDFVAERFGVTNVTKSWWVIVINWQNTNGVVLVWLRQTLIYILGHTSLNIWNSYVFHKWWVINHFLSHSGFEWRVSNAAGRLQIVLQALGQVRFRILGYPTRKMRNEIT